MSMDQWEAHVIDGPDKLRRSVRLVLARRSYDGQYEVNLDDGSWATVPEDQAGLDNTGWVLPTSALAALAAAFHPYAPHKVEVQRLEEALKIERARVDRLLEGRAA